MLLLDMGMRRVWVDAWVSVDLQGGADLWLGVDGVEAETAGRVENMLAILSACVLHGAFVDRRSMLDREISWAVHLQRDMPGVGCRIRMEGQRNELLRVLLNVLVQTLGPTAGADLRITLQDSKLEGKGVPTDVLTERDLLSIEYGDRFIDLPFDVVRRDGDESSDPVLRLFCGHPISQEGFDRLRELLSAWGALLVVGGYADPSDRPVHPRLIAEEIYLVAPEVLEHPLFGLSQSRACFVALCGMLCDAATQVSLRTVEIQ